MDDLADLLLVQRLEDDGLVDAVEKFWAEEPFELLGVLVLGIFALVEGRRAEAQRPPFDRFSADVAGHNDDSVAEVDVASLSVGQPAVVHDLQE